MNIRQQCTVKAYLPVFRGRLSGRVQTGQPGDFDLAFQQIERRVCVQRDGVDRLTIIINDVNTNSAFEHAVAGVRVQVQSVTAGYNGTVHDDRQQNVTGEQPTIHS